MFMKTNLFFPEVGGSIKRIVKRKIRRAFRNTFYRVNYTFRCLVQVLKIKGKK